MKLKSIICFLIFYIVFYSNVVFSQKLQNYIENFPDYKEVVDSFYNNYITGIAEQNHIFTIEFARKPSGWSLIKINHLTKDTVENQFWNTKDKFIKLDVFIKKNDNNNDTLSEYLPKESVYNSNNIRMFKIHTFYGYCNWQDDIIQYLEPISEKLNDEDLYSLARAYSLKFKPHFYDSNTNYFITNKTIIENYYNKAIHYFEIINKRNPIFNDKVGKIQTKYANECVDFYLFYKLIGEDSLSLKCLKPNIYSQEIITNSKNYLSNCPKNAILITNEDNDTYPLIYLQETENYRKDVLILNISFLYGFNFINNISSNGRKLTINKNFYKKVVFIYIHPTNEYVSLDSFFKTLNLQEDLSENLYVNQNYLIHNREIYKSSKFNYFFRNYLVLLDLYNSNSNNPFCFTFINNYSKEVFGDYFESNGLIFKYSPHYKSTLNLKEFTKFLYTLDTTGYCNPKNYAFKKNSNEYIDKIFIKNLYDNILIAIEFCIKDPEYFNNINNKWIEFCSNFVIKPNKEQLSKYKDLTSD